MTTAEITKPKPRAPRTSKYIGRAAFARIVRAHTRPGHVSLPALARALNLRVVDERTCTNPNCRKEFVPVAVTQMQCSRDCSRIMRYARWIANHPSVRPWPDNPGAAAAEE